MPSRTLRTPPVYTCGRSQLVVARHDGLWRWEARVPGARLTAEDRLVIERGVRAGWSVSQIAVAVGKHRTTVAREVARGSGGRGHRVLKGDALRPAATGRRAVYRARVAQSRAVRRGRRPKPCKLVGEFGVVVAGLLQANWSPQQIAALLPVLFPDRQDWRVSHETIYQSLFVQTRGALRQYWPKGHDMRHLTQADCNEVALSLNTRPRQTLGWQTPQQALDKVLRATAA